ncbi:hypothetical protein DN069_18615 [Streptacidiphilus pinicola]|uniref:Membrane protein YczE n=1 Tax=Streptacidiphilus pinicola TaxID=2219663 RepID=A0A2X0K989_9ACTN|nr:hypothetical protein [Streptacidiphilus pinicola]RAG84059.1 hypothetical protein DN069_18615 [Streptacidiphilus pinicola]
MSAVSTLLRPAPFARRMVHLMVGLVLYGVSTALLLRAGLGVDPWTVLHQGLAQVTGLTVGTVSIVVSLLVLCLWPVLRQRPGIGTLLDAVVVGAVTDATLADCPRPHGLWAQVLLLSGAILLNAVATACYLGAGLGAGPRDGLMTGLAERGHSLRATRTLIELSALGIGWLLGGPVGIGTVAYAVSIGPLAQVFIPWLRLRERPS